MSGFYGYQIVFQILMWLLHSTKVYIDTGRLKLYILSRAREAGSPLKAAARTLTRGHPKTKNIQILYTACFCAHNNGISSIESSPYEPSRNIVDILP